MNDYYLNKQRRSVDSDDEDDAGTIAHYCLFVDGDSLSISSSRCRSSSAMPWCWCVRLMLDLAGGGQ